MHRFAESSIAHCVHVDSVCECNSAAEVTPYLVHLLVALDTDHEYPSISIHAYTHKHTHTHTHGCTTSMLGDMHLVFITVIQQNDIRCVMSLKKSV